jgi:ATP-dependent Lon protease
MRISHAALKNVIEGYTRESGVRKLAQRLSRLCRATAKLVVVDEQEVVSVKHNNLEDFLGVAPYENELYQKLDVPGVAIGLAWTPVGGDILFVETSLSRGNGKLTLTGQLGDVMKESATLAYQYLRANAKLFSLNHEVFNHWNIHVHFPAGAIPKDGPSAGIAILSAMASLFTQRLITSRLAMTGEITLRGKVLPVGGIKEKFLAARRAGVQTVLFCKDNKKDVMEIKEEYRKDMNVIYVERMEEVLEHALQPRPIKHGLDLMEPVREAALEKKLRRGKSDFGNDSGVVVKH